MRRRGKGGAENFAQTQISSEYLLKVIGGFDPKPYDNIEKSSKMVVGKNEEKLAFKSQFCPIAFWFQTHLFKSICLLLKVKSLIQFRFRCLYFDPHNFIMRVKIDGFFEAEAPLAYSTHIITDAFNRSVG